MAESGFQTGGLNDRLFVSALRFGAAPGFRLTAASGLRLTARQWQSGLQGGAGCAVNGE